MDSGKKSDQCERLASTQMTMCGPSTGNTRAGSSVTGQSSCGTHGIIRKRKSCSPREYHLRSRPCALGRWRVPWPKVRANSFGTGVHRRSDPGLGCGFCSSEDRSDGRGKSPRIGNNNGVAGSPSLPALVECGVRSCGAANDKIRGTLKTSKII